MDRNPLVSIVITSYNRAHFIEKTIQSALAQDYPNVEVIISDNCSTDGTEKVVKRFLTDSRIHYYKNEINIGMIPNFKLATEERAQGKYIIYVSSDDYFINNNFISEALGIINKYERIYLVFGRVKSLLKDNILVDDNNAHLFTNEFKTGNEVFLNFPNKGALGWGATLINREELNMLNIFSSKATSMDYEANLILMLKGNVGFINKPSYVFRIHDDQASDSKNIETLADNINYVLTPYRYAKEHNLILPEKLIHFRDALLFEEFRRISLRLLAIDKNKYKEFILFTKINHKSAYRRLRWSLKWNILNLLYRSSYVSLSVIKIFSKDHYNFLKSLKRNKSVA